MTLTDLQAAIVRLLAANRSATSYAAGGLVLNRNWPRQSDDLDIFHDTDEEIGAAADVDIETLRNAGYRVAIDIQVYGCVEAIASKGEQSTLIQWMSESRTRFFPLVRDDEWGARLHQADLAVNKIIAASTRTKARDFVDLVMIANAMCPLGALLMAAAGKPPHFSPQKMIDEIRRRGLSVADEQYMSVKGLSPDATAATVRADLISALDKAERYVLGAPTDLVGVLAADENETPVEVSTMAETGIIYRTATAEAEVMPSLPDAPFGPKGE
jgi:hypothetical protein